MMEVPQMIVIGAAGRNVGKTEFARELIRMLAPRGNVIGVKITTVREENAACPRGGQGCGVCGALKVPYLLAEETASSSGKDTARMLQAGASRVFWLRVRHAHLAKGVRALSEHLPAGTPVVCESNSVREVAAPGCFVIIREKHSETIKDSCRRVMAMADRLITFNGSGWDTHPGDLVFDQERWWMRMDATAIALAGGRSRRMGRDKSMLSYNGKPMLLHITDQLRPHFAALLVGANDAQRYGIAGAPVIPDRVPDQGPLMGLASCLEAVRTDRAFLTGCDIPTMDIPTIRAMVAGLDDHDAVVPVTDDGRRHPLFAAYRRSVLPVAQAVLAQGQRRMEDMLSQVRVLPFPLGRNDWFRNLNTPEDYAAACEAAKPAKGKDEMHGPVRRGV